MQWPMLGSSTVRASVAFVSCCRAQAGGGERKVPGFKSQAHALLEDPRKRAARESESGHANQLVDQDEATGFIMGLQAAQSISVLF